MGWFSNVVHGALDMAGMIPGVGAVADGLNAVIYLAEGEYANAAMSAVAMVPGIGDSIALASKGAKVMKGIKGLSKLEKAKFLLKGAKKMGANALDSVKGLMKEGGRLLKDFDYQYAWNSIKDKTKCFFGKGKCFTGDTLVKVQNGYVPIREIKAGDLVWSMDEESGETALKRVEEVFCTQAHTIYEIEIEGKEVVKATAYHPFYVAERGWVDAIQLEEGNLLVTEDGAAEITQIRKYRQDEPIETYNFHVEDWCSYFVSEQCVYVHNMEDGHPPIKEIIKDAMGNGKPPKGNGKGGSIFEEVFETADNYKLSDDTFNGHILDRHGPNSTYGNKSHFDNGFDIKKGIDETLKSDKSIVKPNTSGRDGNIFEQTFTSPIGKDSKGRPINTLKVVTDSKGNVITAFPKK